MKFVKSCKDGFVVGFMVSFIAFGYRTGKVLTNALLEKIANKLDDKVTELEEKESNITHVDFAGKDPKNE